MELSALVREIDSAPDAAAPARIERSRQAVLREIEGSGRRSSRSRWIWGGSAALGTLTAGVAIAAVVIVGTVSPITAQPASAAAIAVLNEAADLVITGVDPVVRPGQYLQVRETYELVSLWDIDEDTDLSDPVAGFNTPRLTTAEGAVFARGVRDLYVPSDRDDDWILDDRAVNEVLDVFGDPDVLPAYDRLIAAYPHRDADPGGIHSLPAGSQSWDPSTTDDDRYWDPLRDEYADMPLDPQLLLDWYRTELGVAPGDDWSLFQSIGRYLSTDVMPADLRASSLRVLGLLSGVDVISTAGDVTTLGMSVSQGEGGGFGDVLLSELDIDTSTGRIVGSRESYPDRSTDLLPAGIPWVSWSIAVTVVDQAPRP